MAVPGYAASWACFILPLTSPMLCSAGGQGAIDPHDVSEAVLLAFRCSANCVPEEIVLKAARPQ